MSAGTVQGIWGQSNPVVRDRRRFFGASVATVEPVSSRILYQLLLLNIVLQMFDGIATYAGISLGVQEGNPLLCYSFGLCGVGATLVLAKSFACGLLLLLYCAASVKLAAQGLCVAAGVYCVCSLVPWLAILLATLGPLF